MGFDRSSTANLLKLKGLIADPTLGTPQILAFLASDGGQQGVAPLLSGDLLRMIFQQNISGPNEFNINLLFTICSGANGTKCDVSEFRAELIAMNDVGLNLLIEAHKRTLSVAEVAFSELDANDTNEFVVISRDDWLAARDHVVEV